MAGQNQQPQIQITDPVQTIGKKLDFFITIVISILIVGFITLIVTVGGLIIDSFHVNSAIYKEYTAKTETTNQLLEINKQLLETNKKLLEDIKLQK